MVDLYRMRYLIKRYPRACYREEEARIRAQKLTRPISDESRGGGGNSTEEGLILYAAAKERKQAIADELAAMRKELEPLIDRLDNPLQIQAMRMRYLEGRSVREISYSLCYSEQHIFRVVHDAEQIVSKDESYES